MIYQLLRLVSLPFVRFVWRTRVHGLERLPEGPFVLAANHESVLDPFVLAVAIPRHVRFLGKAEFWRNPVVGWIGDHAGAIPVVRDVGDVDAIERVTAALRGGDVVGIFPQGTVLGGPERPWRRGAARVALESGVPVVPVRLVGTERAIAPVSHRIGRPTIHVLVGAPISPDSVEPGDVAATALTEAVRAAVEELGRPFGPPLPAYRRRS